MSAMPHAGFVHANADAKAGDARLRDFEKRGADLKAVADAHGVIHQSFDRKTLAELPVNEIAPLQLLLPITIRFDLIHEHSSMFAAVPGQIALTVALEIQAAGATAAVTAFFQTPVCTVRPFHATSRGSPTFTDSNRAIRLEFLPREFSPRRGDAALILWGQLPERCAQS